eukprot:CAMPEP_0184859710 /NCGR_PEP_ID=MMETSP0580-20130426/4696_1 /TAXON_ID=1118495 /ORGANISM="Dactyliosolen fragilissimus" /LENGTH=933 /DNA_ID=CAMNT_0027356501 /DNA_START=227 /DNA_END=3028 /DNA_ORIENTATION=+
MSTRALRKLREERENEILLQSRQQRIQEYDSEKEEEDAEIEEEWKKNRPFGFQDDDSDDDEDSGDDDDYDDSEEEEEHQKRRNTFAFVMDSEDSEDEEEDSEGSENNNNEEENETINSQSIDNGDKNKAFKEQHKQTRKKDAKEKEVKEEEDLDKILYEFGLGPNPNLNLNHALSNNPQQLQQQQENGLRQRREEDDVERVYRILRSNIDTKDYNLDYSLRSMLGGGVGAPIIENQHNPNRPGRANTQRGNANSSNSAGRKFLFGRPKEEWCASRPPSFLGGGLGLGLDSPPIPPMENVESHGKEEQSRIFPPWPYNILHEIQMSNTNPDINTSTNHTLKHQASIHIVPSLTTRPISLSDTSSSPQTQIEDTLTTTQHQSHRWLTFMQSETYQNRLQSYQTTIEPSGDANALAMFVADNPHHVEPLLQLAAVLFRINRREDGMELLKRTLWILECAAAAAAAASSTSTSSSSIMTHHSFLPSPHDKITYVHYDRTSYYSNATLMDSSLPSNAPIFLSLFELMRTAGMMGCVTTALAAARLVLSLDPLRDTLGTLLLMDYFALASLRECDDEFVISLVQSRALKIYYKYEDVDSSEKGTCCNLEQMPNWAFSYALALYRQNIHQGGGNDEIDHQQPHEEKEGIDTEVQEGSTIDDNHKSVNANNAAHRNSPVVPENAHDALVTAIRLYPNIPQMLLEQNKINVQGRSFERDWPTILDHLQKQHTKITSKNNADICKAVNLITDIFVLRGHKLWCGDHILQWLYDACVAALPEIVEEPGSLQTDEMENVTEDCDASSTFYPIALERYLRCDPEDYEPTFRQLPADANPLDPNLVAPAMAVNPNRRRMLRLAHPRGMGRLGNQNQRRLHDMDNENENMNGMEQLMQRMRQDRAMIGGMGRADMEVVDPDLPLTEVFWRSFLPWTRVDGVPTARRPP